MSRVYNFSAGPAVLPEEVLREAAEEMMDYKGSGMSVMEMSHRSKIYDAIIKEAEADLRELMNIPDNYRVLFLQGGASQQFAIWRFQKMRIMYIFVKTTRFMERNIKRFPIPRDIPWWQMCLLAFCLSRLMCQSMESFTEACRKTLVRQEW